MQTHAKVAQSFYKFMKLITDSIFSVIFDNDVNTQSTEQDVQIYRYVRAQCTIVHTSLSRFTHRRNAVAAKLNSSHSSAAQPYVNHTPIYTHCSLKLNHKGCAKSTI